MPERRPVRTLAMVAGATGLTLWLVGERGRPGLPSSLRSLRQLGLRRVLDLSIVHTYVYGRWTRQYMAVLRRLIPCLGERAGLHLVDGYHAKVLTPALAQAVIRLDRDIPLRDLEQVIPYARARDLVLTGPPEMALYQCACRLSRPDHCEPTQVCLVMGQPFVDFVLDHHPQGARRVDAGEALALLRQEHQRGHVHTAWFKDAAMGRFYAICNCCSCCCVGLEAMVRYGVPMMSPSGYVAQVDVGSCSRCGACEDACPFGALEADERGVAKVVWERCMGCSVCQDACPQEAIALVRDERKGTPLDVRAMTGGKPSSPSPLLPSTKEGGASSEARRGLRSVSALGR